MEKLNNTQKFNSKIKVGNHLIGSNEPTFFIAEIGSNFDSDLVRAKELIFAAKEAGAHCAKFQHYNAESLVSDIGFKNLKSNSTHQNTWKGTVFETYKKASLNPEWTFELKESCDKANILFMTSPYSIELVDFVEKFVPAYKIGSGDITWLEEVEYIAKKNKPVFLATGASNITEVTEAVETIANHNENLILMQCNTNYTNSDLNFNHLNLLTLKSFKDNFPGIVTGLSDHTQNDQAVLASVALGARVIERHFTDSTDRDGPDHSFSMDFKAWEKMVSKVKDLEKMLGDGNKKVEENEKETIIVQRRALYAKKLIKKGEIIKKENLIPLRPCPAESFIPVNQINKISGKKAIKEISQGEPLKLDYIE